MFRDRDISMRLISKNKNRKGSALLLVVVVTVLLAAIGVIFLMMSRLEEMATSSVAEKEQLEAAAEAVVAQIGAELTADLFDEAGNWKANTSTGYGPVADPAQPWLASLEPNLISDADTPYDPGDDSFAWGQLTDLYANGFRVPSDNEWYDASIMEVTALNIDDEDTVAPYKFSENEVVTRIIKQGEGPGLVSREFIDTSGNGGKIFPWGGRADADGDGVADSRWVPLPGITGTRGENVYAAVRIVDNCAMLNLNTALECPADSEGEHLTAVDYTKFLRGSDAFDYNAMSGDGDNLTGIREARWPSEGYVEAEDTIEYWHNFIMTGQQSPDRFHRLFEVSDEIELRNRFLLTSNVEARFEQKDVANYSLDSGGGVYSALSIPVDQASGLIKERWGRWVVRMDNRNFADEEPGDPLRGPDDDNPAPYRYDRRHVCTFYSFDRNLGKVAYPYVNGETLLVDETKPHDILTPRGVVKWLKKQMTEQELKEYAGLYAADMFMPFYGPVNLRDIRMLPADASEEEKLEVRKTVLQALYAFRAYYLEKYGDETVEQAAIRAAQAVANIIDYIDGDGADGKVGPFADPLYGSQISAEPTYIDRDVVLQLTEEVCQGVIGSTYWSGDPTRLSMLLDEVEFGFGINAAEDVVYGFERQPFISEVAIKISSDGTSIEQINFEMFNPYSNTLYPQNYEIRVGSDSFDFSSEVVFGSGRKPVLSGDGIDNGIVTAFFKNNRIELVRKASDIVVGRDAFVVDYVPSSKVNSLLQAGAGEWSFQRDESEWKFSNAESFGDISVSTIGIENSVNADPNGFQLPVANDDQPIATLLDLEKVATGLTVYQVDDPNMCVTEFVSDADKSGEKIRFDIETDPKLLDYVCLLNRPEGDLPGRININTATREVIRAAIPADAADPQRWEPDALAQAVVDYRESGEVFNSIGDLLKVPGWAYLGNGPEEVDGTDQRVIDFEDRDYILSRVANVFTTRSDTFTAYILVRMGEDGPQKRMIAIYDRTNVVSPTDRPKLVALHPVPNPR